MTREELLRILNFVDDTRSISEQDVSLSSIDPRWNIISYAMRRHLEGKLLTITSLAMAANVPYGTAMRRVNELIDEGLLMRRPRSKSGKSYSIHPTRNLIKYFESFAMHFKALVGRTFGFNTGDNAVEDFYFGGYYMASRILSYPNAIRKGPGYNKTIRILAPIDPTFKTIHKFASNLNELCGTNLEVVNLPIDQLYGRIVKNAKSRHSNFDLIAVDLPWIGQLAEEGIIQPLDDIIRQERYNSSDFHTAAWKGSSYKRNQYGLPIQPTVELMFCRSDLFADAGLDFPRTTEDVLSAARTLHRSDFDLSGIVMNYGRGIPVAHTFVQTLADHGQPVINLAPQGDGFTVDEIKGGNFRPMIDTEVGRRTAEYLMELRDYAHPESLKCDWDRRIAIFSGGRAAMTYGWSVRAAAFELDEDSPAHGRVEFIPHPHGPGAATVSPIGGFALAMPTGLSEDRIQSAWKVMEYLTRPEMLKWYVQHGNLTSPRFSTSADPEVQAISPLIGKIDAMERRGEFQTWPRPPIPEFNEILNVLGDEMHAMLAGWQPVAAALSNSQNRIDSVMRSRGHY
jgi:multiple sugar transport system substrate-binding protein